MRQYLHIRRAGGIDSIESSLRRFLRVSTLDSLGSGDKRGEGSCKMIILL